jgi:hypothetical protein
MSNNDFSLTIMDLRKKAVKLISRNGRRFHVPEVGFLPAKACFPNWNSPYENGDFAA